jgi:hypothetical protein
MALFDCQGNRVALNDDGCGVGQMPELEADLFTGNGPYYLLVDGDSSWSDGPFGIGMWYPENCSDSVVDGDETDVDCGGSICDPCADGLSCGTNSDCVNGNCSGGVCAAAVLCTEALAVDIGSVNTWVTVSTDACIMVRDAYPWKWSYDPMQLSNRNSGDYPLTFTWSNSCSGNSGSETFEYNTNPKTFGPVSEHCATVIDLQGTGADTIQLKYRRK